jgi:hypothetical protein
VTQVTRFIADIRRGLAVAMSNWRSIVSRGTQAQSHNEPDLDLLYAEVRTQLDTQLSSMDALDAKIGLLFGIGAAEAGIASAILITRQLFTVPTLIVVAIFAMSYCALSIAAFWAMFRAKVRIGPPVELLSASYARGEGRKVVKARVVRTLRDCYHHNGRYYLRKSRGLAVCIITLTLETLAVLVVLVLTTAIGPSQGSGSDTAPPEAHRPAVQASTASSGRQSPP